MPASDFCCFEHDLLRFTTGCFVGPCKHKGKGSDIKQPGLTMNVRGRRLTVRVVLPLLFTYIGKLTFRVVSKESF